MTIDPTGAWCLPGPLVYRMELFSPRMIAARGDGNAFNYIDRSGDADGKRPAADAGTEGKRSFLILNDQTIDFVDGAPVLERIGHRWDAKEQRSIEIVHGVEFVIDRPFWQMVKENGARRSATSDVRLEKDGRLSYRDTPVELDLRVGHLDSVLRWHDWIVAVGTAADKSRSTIKGPIGYLLWFSEKDLKGSYRQISRRRGRCRSHLQQVETKGPPQKSRRPTKERALSPDQGLIGEACSVDRTDVGVYARNGRRPHRVGVYCGTRFGEEESVGCCSTSVHRKRNGWRRLHHAGGGGAFRTLRRTTALRRLHGWILGVVMARGWDHALTIRLGVDARANRVATAVAAPIKRLVHSAG